VDMESHLRVNPDERGLASAAAVLGGVIARRSSWRTMPPGSVLAADVAALAAIADDAAVKSSSASGEVSVSACVSARVGLFACVCACERVCV
jgi:hypothetical protein